MCYVEKSSTDVESIVKISVDLDYIELALRSHKVSVSLNKVVKRLWKYIICLYFLIVYLKKVIR